MRAAADDNDTTRLGLRRTGSYLSIAGSELVLAPRQASSCRRSSSIRFVPDPSAAGRPRGMGRAMSSVGDTGSGAGAHVRSEPHSIRGFAVRSHRRAALALALLAVPGPL